MRRLVGLLLVLLCLPFASAASASLVSDDVEPYVFGLDISGDYFVVSVSDEGFSIGFSPETPVKRVVEMSYWDFGQFFIDYSFSGSMERVGLLSSTFMIPVGKLLDMEGLGVEN